MLVEDIYTQIREILHLIESADTEEYHGMLIRVWNELRKMLPPD